MNKPFVKPEWCGQGTNINCRNNNSMDWMEFEMVSWRDTETGALVAPPECECKKRAELINTQSN